MALSEHEQRLLEEMERGLYRSEADVLQTPSGGSKPLNLRFVVLGIVLGIIGIGVLVGGVAAQQLWLGLVGFGFMLGGTVLAFSRGNSDDVASMPAGTRAGSAREARPQRASFSERLEQRWDERMDGDR